jgi:serine/threonine protein kinase
MEDPDLIATLIPADQWEFARNVFQLPSNEKHHLKPTVAFADIPTISSREATPGAGVGEIDETAREYDSAHRIQLRFDRDLRNPAKGYGFGTKDNVCDIQLGGRGVIKGVGGNRFHITFSEQGDLILNVHSTHGVAVSYNSQAENEIRHQFTWRLDFKTEDDRQWDVEVHVPNKMGLAFKINLATHHTCQAEYEAKLNKFIANSRNPLSRMNALDVETPGASEIPSATLSPREPPEPPIYIHERSLGNGSFGAVDMVVDVSTGFKYARKRFLVPPWERDQKRRERQKERWLGTVRKEIRIMRSYPHVSLHELISLYLCADGAKPNIVAVIEYWETPAPILIMQYMSWGNLSALHRASPITRGEIESIAFQTLTALAYLHPQGVAHRDLKPENILAESRYPLRVKLADFGLANDKTDLRTFCGTRGYAAPEVFSNESYTTAMDIWPLGVIMLQYLYSLPRTPSKKRRQNDIDWILSYCRCLVDHVSHLLGERSDDLLSLVATGMLRVEAEERSSASACLAQGYELGLFREYTTESALATPTQLSFHQAEMDRDNGSTSILLGALWEAGEASDADHNAIALQLQSVPLKLQETKYLAL